MTQEVEMGHKNGVIESWDAFSELFERFGKLKAKLSGLVAGRDRALMKVKATFAEETREPEAESKELEERLATFLREHRSELGEDTGRFRDLPTGRVGFRRTPERIVLAPNTDWDQVLELCRGDRRRFGKYVKVEESIDKALLLRATDEELRVLGLAKTQEDRPYLTWMETGGLGDLDE
jgi:phage host-nuclease inhibitor protein Gam